MTMMDVHDVMQTDSCMIPTKS